MTNDQTEAIILVNFQTSPYNRITGRQRRRVEELFRLLELRRREGRQNTRRNYNGTYRKTLADSIRMIRRTLSRELPGEHHAAYRMWRVAEQMRG